MLVLKLGRTFKWNKDKRGLRIIRIVIGREPTRKMKLVVIE